MVKDLIKKLITRKTFSGAKFEGGTNFLGGKLSDKHLDDFISVGVHQLGTVFTNRFRHVGTHSLHCLFDGFFSTIVLKFLVQSGDNKFAEGARVGVIDFGCKNRKNKIRNFEINIENI